MMTRKNNTQKHKPIREDIHTYNMHHLNSSLQSKTEKRPINNRFITACLRGPGVADDTIAMVFDPGSVVKTDCSAVLLDRLVIVVPPPPPLTESSVEVVVPVVSTESVVSLD
jgi:hypothetical protein